jgi:hypothetical protein
MSDRGHLDHSNENMGTPWWIYETNDYTKKRSALQYSSPDKIIGKKDYYKYTLTTNDPATVSGHDAKVLR